MKLNIQPIRLILYYLVVMSVLGSLSWTLLDPMKLVMQAVHYAMIFGAMYVTGFIYFKIRPTVAKPRFEDRLITSLILFLLFSSDLAIWVFPLVGAVTELMQRVIRLPSGPVFNPAALGTLVVAFTGQLPLWWGTNFSPRIPITAEGISLSACLTFPLAGYIAWKYRKLPIAIALMVATGILYPFIMGLGHSPYKIYNPTYILLEGTLAFFALVMAIEPKTSPVLRNEQIAFGVGVGILLILLLKLYFVEPYVASLLIVNGIFQGYKYWKMRKPRPVQPVTVQNTTTSQPVQTTPPVTPVS